MLLGYFLFKFLLSVTNVRNIYHQMIYLMGLKKPYQNIRGNGIKSEKVKCLNKFYIKLYKNR